ncbi:hypothetical protein J7E83_11770 [Arthrobacter sp. ISL-48]|uniref:hypothetical protein n=1 Tax=Arthrobacter sp. ISL-48 TaxID=2819110 RepID=UPI001BE8282A|nr:hypothetical protein [Arthrobacter sp. ISL-48]MBT2532788.1 hypothetical protein [Arthrobacter sp. ISL-48]
MSAVSTATRPVRISSSPLQLQTVEPLLESVQAEVGNVPALLAIAENLGRSAARPGVGETVRLWELLASVTAVDVAAGRVLEPHLDAVAILSQSGMPMDAMNGAWGVFAAEGPGLRLEATRDGAGGYILTGTKPWCSLAEQLRGAVVTAHLPDRDGRGAFAVNLEDPGVACQTPNWISRGLSEIPSGNVHFASVPATLIGQPGWYYERPGFAWGGMGVAACWFGGAVAVAREFRDSLVKAAERGREPDQVALAHLGEIDRIIAASTGYLAGVAEGIDAGELSGSNAWSEALRVRGAVATAVERIQALVVQNLGPGPLAFNENYGKRMADLSLYIRQHHAMRDDAQLGALTLQRDCPW